MEPAKLDGVTAMATGDTLTTTQRRTAEAIVNIFETGTVLSDYGQVTLIPGDSGHLTFGRSQTTLSTGNLGRLLQQYVTNPGARFGARLRDAAMRAQAIDLTLDTDPQAHNLLRASADDPVMRDTQDRFFTQRYWQPALDAALQRGIRTALGVAVVYDSYVHGSWAALRDQVDSASGRATDLGERAWIRAYVTARRDWLAHHAREDLRPTVYRMQAFERLIALDQWGLERPLRVRSQEISELTLNAIPPNCYDGPQPGSRVLALQAPMTRGLDVRTLQLALSDRGADLRADGAFGQATAQQLRAFQQRAGLPPTGSADSQVWGRLLA
ncbi:MAG: peptidoglycan-binding protein [Pseudorhodoferax sp.]